MNRAYRSTAAALSLALLASTAGCRSYPGTAVAAGVVTAAVGTLIAVSPEPDGDEVADQVALKGGITLALVGVGLATAGVIGWAQNATPSPNGPSPQPNAAAERPAVTAVPASDARLVTHVRLAAREQRCEAALYLLRALEQREPAEAQALRATDERVGHCLTVAMRAD